MPTVMVRHDSKNICLFKEFFKSHRFFPILWAYPSVVLIGLFLLIAFKNTLTSWQTLKSSPKKEKIQHSQTSHHWGAPDTTSNLHLLQLKVTYSLSVLLLGILQINAYPKITWKLEIIMVTVHACVQLYRMFVIISTGNDLPVWGSSSQPVLFPQAPPQLQKTRLLQSENL